jgi:hypothetical protein
MDIPYPRLMRNVIASFSNTAGCSRPGRMCENMSCTKALEKGQLTFAQMPLGLGCLGSDQDNSLLIQLNPEVMKPLSGQ